MKRYLTLMALAMFPIFASCETKEETDKAAAAAPGEAAATTAPEKAPKVRLKTSMGDIVLELNAEKAPISVENFLSYVKKKHYDDTVFHRVLPNFMIQGGGFTVVNGQMNQKSVDRPIKNEGQNGLKNLRGTIAMARTAALDSATSQFFINVVDNAGLDYPNNGGYAVFGKVVEGMDVVDKIKAGKTVTDPRGEPSVPVEPVVIKSAAIE
jgi:cyclophilin family peptidyl-prolyl cis-trans isomerase